MMSKPKPLTVSWLVEVEGQHCVDMLEIFIFLNKQTCFVLFCFVCLFFFLGGGGGRGGRFVIWLLHYASYWTV